MFAHMPLARANRRAKPDISRQGGGLLPHGSREVGGGMYCPLPEKGVKSWDKETIFHGHSAALQSGYFLRLFPGLNEPMWRAHGT